MCVCAWGGRAVGPFCQTAPCPAGRVRVWGDKRRVGKGSSRNAVVTDSGRYNRLHAEGWQSARADCKL